MRRTGVNTKLRIYRIIKPALKIWMKRKFNLEAVLPKEVEELKPPYLILSNHHGYWDAVNIGVNISTPISFIATDATFRSPLFGFALRILGVIPKTKAISDMHTLKNVYRVKQAGGIIGIFPETRRTWDGTTLPLLFSVSKLIKALKIPVVTTVIKGGYLSHPRWGTHIQKGKIKVEYSLLLKKGETAKFSTEEIHSNLISALDHDEFTWQEQEEISFKGKNPAESMELVLFICPSCREQGTMQSKGSTFWCRSCNYNVEYNHKRKFVNEDSSVIFKNIRDWSRWQKKEFIRFMENISNEKTAIAEDYYLEFHTGYKSKKTRHFGFGSLHLNKKILTIKGSNGDVLLDFPVNQLSGIEAQNKERLEFYHNKTLYNVRSRKKGLNVNKWLWAFEFLQSL